jgi:HK97 family phage prohead protease
MTRYFAPDRETEVTALRAALKTGAFPKLRRDFVTEIKAADDSRAFDFTISTAAVDRYGDTVAVDGWKLANFRKNPVVLWMHDNTMLPVGKAVNVRVEDGKLKARTEFTPAEMVRFNDIVFEMIKGGFLSTTSVGFIPLKYAFVDDPERRFGIDFQEQELLEFSIVTVPANPEALIEGRMLQPGELKTLEIVDDPAMSLELAQRRLSLLKVAA